VTLPTVILAGGLGSRVSKLTGDRVPKALIDVAGRPFLDRKLDELSAQGVTDVIVLVAHHGDKVRDYLVRHPRGDLQAACFDDGPTLLGTGGAIVQAREHLPAAFFVTYGDTLLDQPMAPVEDAFTRCGRPALMTVVHNEDRQQTSNATVSEGLVVAYSKLDPPGTHEYLDYGLLVFRREMFNGFPVGAPCDLETIVARLVADRLMAAMVVNESFHDVGTPEAVAKTASRYVPVEPSDTMS
jgi:NDP-sugar pyrophosphorylase family protein